MAAARGIVAAQDGRQLLENGGHIFNNRDWAYSLHT